jgi:branched-subunit amino acid aminotransferase/4-amino-4-deoxychorismate lyase
MQNLLLTESSPDSEILFLNSKGNIIEGTRSNILCIKDNILYYVDLSENYLHGIMQSRIVSDHKEFGISDAQAVKGGFQYDFIKECSEVLIVNSLMIARSCSSVSSGGNSTKFNTAGISVKIRNYYLKSLLS